MRTPPGLTRKAAPMNPRRSCRWAQAAASEEEDLRLQGALLLHLLTQYPIQLTQDDLIRELSQDAADFGERDGIERAVHQLVAVGLLRRHDSFVLPTPPAFRSYELWSM